MELLSLRLVVATGARTAREYSVLSKPFFEMSGQHKTTG